MNENNQRTKISNYHILPRFALKLFVSDQVDIFFFLYCEQVMQHWPIKIKDITKLNY